MYTQNYFQRLIAIHLQSTLLHYKNKLSFIKFTFNSFLTKQIQDLEKMSLLQHSDHKHNIKQCIDVTQ